MSCTHSRTVDAKLLAFKGWNWRTGFSSWLRQDKDHLTYNRTCLHSEGGICVAIILSVAN